MKCVIVVGSLSQGIEKIVGTFDSTQAAQEALYDQGFDENISTIQNIETPEEHWESEVCDA